MKRNTRCVLSGLVAITVTGVSLYLTSNIPERNIQNDRNIESIVIQEEAKKPEDKIETNNSESAYIPKEITYVEMGDPKGINLIKKTKAKDVETFNAKFSLGNYNLVQGLSYEEFFSEIEDLPKRIELEALLDLSKIQRVIGRIFMKEPVEQYIKRKDVIDDFLEISKKFEETKRGTINELIDFSKSKTLKGEIVLVVNNS